MLTAIAVIKGNIIRVRRPYAPSPSEGGHEPEGVLIQAKAVTGKGRKSILVPVPEPASVPCPPCPAELRGHSVLRSQAVGVEGTRRLESVRVCAPVLLGEPPRRAVVTGEVRVESEYPGAGSPTRVHNLNLPFSTLVELTPEATSADGVTFTGEWEAEARAEAEIAEPPGAGRLMGAAVIVHISVLVTEACLMRILCER